MPAVRSAAPGSSVVHRRYCPSAHGNDCVPYRCGRPSYIAIRSHKKPACIAGTSPALFLVNQLQHLPLEVRLPMACRTTTQATNVPS